MKTIVTTDTIVATLQRGAEILASLHTCGLGSLADVIKSLRASCPGATGLVTLSLRNATQGWVSRHRLLMPA